MRIRRRLGGEEHVNANPGDERGGGEDYDPVAHDRSSGCCRPRTRLVPGRSCFLSNGILRGVGKGVERAAFTPVFDGLWRRAHAATPGRLSCSVWARRIRRSAPIEVPRPPLPTLRRWVDLIENALQLVRCRKVRPRGVGSACERRKLLELFGLRRGGRRLRHSPMPAAARAHHHLGFLGSGGYTGTAGTKPSRFGISTFGRLLASRTSFSWMMPLR